MTTPNNEHRNENNEAGISNAIQDVKTPPLNLVTTYEKHPEEAPQSAWTKDHAAYAPEVLHIDRSVPFAVITDSHGDGLSSDLILSPTPDRDNPPETTDTSETEKTVVPEDETHPHRICGLSKTKFYILLALAIVFTAAAAIGGGVGGSLSRQNRDAAASPASLPTSTSSTSSLPFNLTTTTSLIFPTAPTTITISGYRLEVWNQRNYTGTSLVFTAIGYYPLPFPSAPTLSPDPFNGTLYNSAVGNSYVWIPNDSGCCVRTCWEGRAKGYRCTSATTIPATALDRVIVSCGGQVGEGECARVLVGGEVPVPVSAEETTRNFLAPGATGVGSV